MSATVCQWCAKREHFLCEREGCGCSCDRPLTPEVLMSFVRAESDARAKEIYDARDPKRDAGEATASKVIHSLVLRCRKADCRLCDPTLPPEVPR